MLSDMLRSEMFKRGNKLRAEGKRNREQEERWWWRHDGGKERKKKND
jgi:hypothetical protein